MRTSLLCAIAALAGFCAAAGCGKRPPPPGGGEHRITGITLSAKGGVKECRVGEKVQLDVSAWWAIPSRTDATANSQFKVEPADMGEVKEGGVFVPARAGRATLTASYSPTEFGIKQTFTSSLALKVNE